MNSNICIFEDIFVTKLSPINYLRHSSEIICGANSLLQNTLLSISAKNKIILHSRKYLTEYLSEKYPNFEINNVNKQDCLFLNSRVLYDKKNLNKIIKFLNKNINTALVKGNTIIAFFTDKNKTEKYTEVINKTDDNLVSFADLEWLDIEIIYADEIIKDELRIINYPSDLILYFDERLNYDLNKLDKKRGSKKKIQKSKTSKIYNKSDLDSTAGSIFIGENTIIEPHVYIKGPVYIGANSTIRAGSQIYGPSRIGSWCKVSGEITNTIISDYVNKQHYGFLGHSYLCEWVNLGAGTTTSNLKNNYSEITLDIEGETIKTNSIFLGSIIGDHTKTGIQTMLNTGTIIGISCNLYGAGYHNKKVKSFSWEDASNDNKLIEYELEKAIKTAKISMARRKIELSKAYENMLRYLWEKRTENII